MRSAQWAGRLSTGWAGALFSLVAGGAQAASLALPWSGEACGALQLMSLAGLVWQLDRAGRPAQAALSGGLFAWGWLTGTFWWLFISMHVYGGLAAPLAVLAVLGLAAFLGSYYLVAAGLYRWLAASAAQAGWQRPLLFSALWTLAELLRGHWFTGFPWGAGGYAHVDGAARWLAPWIGVYGCGAVMAGLAAVLAGAVGRRRCRGGASGLAVWAVLAWVPAPEWAASSSVLQVSLLQGNIPQDEKFQAGSGIPVALQWYDEQLQANRSPLVVAPETALPLLPEELPAGYWSALLQRYGDGFPRPGQPPQAALVGIPLGNSRAGYTNSVIGLLPSQGQPPYVYSKHHLVPFGEFVPPLFRWFTEMMDIPLGDFNAGDPGQPSMPWQGQRLAPNICYEDLFGEELGVRFRDPAQAPTILVNLSNIGWFGDSVAIDQHLNISRLRALEFARPMIRATNTGATAIIDHRGRVLQRLPSLRRAVLTGPVEGRGLVAGGQGWGITPYAWWVSRLGLAPLWGASLLVLLGFLWRRRAAVAPASI